MNRETTTTRVFTHSFGAVLFTVALALSVSNIATRDLLLPRDPLLMLPMRQLIWIVAGIAGLLGLYCLFGRNTRFQLGAVVWLALNFSVYRLCLFYGGYPRFHGHTGSLPTVFRLSATTIDIAASIIFGLLLVGGAGVFLVQWRRDSQYAKAGYLKMFCHSCGGHIEFLSQALGQKRPCPHCETEVTLRKPENLKMSCFFCKGHIEFPSHAIGKKMPCPHCKQDITLKEPPGLSLAPSA